MSPPAGDLPKKPLRFRLSGALSALSASPEQDWVAVAGREGIKSASRVSAGFPETVFDGHR